ncbi:hypothetical protein Lal_00011271 [Lupinus albus]|nr:hypothetical protein Lal_00011271 [Lupinus albus]
MEGVEIDVARLMATEIYKTAVKGGKKGTRGFPSLITSLYARQGVTVYPTEPIKTPITKQYIKQNCREETAESQGQTSQQQQQPQQQEQEQHHLTMEQKIVIHLEHLEFRMTSSDKTFSMAWGQAYISGETTGTGEPSGSGADEDEETYDEELL